MEPWLKYDLSLSMGLIDYLIEVRYKGTDI